MIEIYRKGLLLMSNDEVIPAKGSSDVPVKFINDTETYQDYLIEPHIGYYKASIPKSLICEYNSENSIIKLPAEVFKQKGVIVMSVALVDHQDENHIEFTKEIAFEITSAPNGIVILPAKENWETAVANLVTQLYDVDYKPNFDKALQNINNAVDTANTASSNATEALSESNETNQLINQKVQDGSFVPNITIGDTMTADAGTQAKVTKTGSKSEPVFNFEIPKGKDGKGQSSIFIDDVVQENIILSSQRDASATKIFVQLKDTLGNAVMIETSQENVFLKNSEGNEMTLKDYASLVSKCIAGCALFNLDFDVSQITELEKFIVAN